MIDLANLAKSHAAIQRIEKALPDLRVVRLMISPPRAFSAEQPPSSAASFGGKPGWARFRSAVRWTHAIDPNDLQILGPALAAEWTEGVSSFQIHAHPSVPGQSVLQEYRDVNEGGETYLCQRTSLVALRTVKGEVDGRCDVIPPLADHLLYDVCWTVGDDGAARRAFSVFRGFGEQPA